MPLHTPHSFMSSRTHQRQPRPLEDVEKQNRQENAACKSQRCKVCLVLFLLFPLYHEEDCKATLIFHYNFKNSPIHSWVTKQESDRLPLITTKNQHAHLNSGIKGG